MRLATAQSLHASVFQNRVQQILDEDPKHYAPNNKGRFMKKPTLLLSSLCLILFGSTLFAGNGQKNEPGVRSLRFEEIREACTNPAKFHNQVAPTNIQIACRDVQTKWVPDTDGSKSMACGRNVTASVMSDKYTVNAITGHVPVSPLVSACPRYKQVEESMETIRSVSCEELVAFTGSAIDFCAGAANSVRSDNKEGIAIRDTGRVIDFCSNAEESGQRQR